MHTHDMAASSAEGGGGGALFGHHQRSNNNWGKHTNSCLSQGRTLLVWKRHK